MLQENHEGAVPEGVRQEGSKGPGFALRMDKQSQTKARGCLQNHVPLWTTRELWLSHCSFMSFFPWGLEKSVQPVLITQ